MFFNELPVGCVSQLSEFSLSVKCPVLQLRAAGKHRLLDSSSSCLSLVLTPPRLVSSLSCLDSFLFKMPSCLWDFHIPHYICAKNKKNQKEGYFEQFIIIIALISKIWDGHYLFWKENIIFLKCPFEKVKIYMWVWFFIKCSNQERKEKLDICASIWHNLVKMSRFPNFRKKYGIENSCVHNLYWV